MTQKRIISFLLFLVLLFSFVVRVYRITEPPKYYYDEVYHVVTARAYSQNNPAAYDPFAPAPEPNTAFDWLHPPLAKLIQAASIKIVGDNSLGWRLPSAIFGTGIIAATYVLATLLFGPMAGIFAAGTIAFENLNLVMSRITMNDVYVTFFITVSFIFTCLYVKSSTSEESEPTSEVIGKTGATKFLVLTSIFLGLAVSSKWTGAYAIIASFAFILFAHLRGVYLKTARLHLGGVPKLFLLLLIPFMIYLLSYGQFWLQGHSIKQFIDLNKQIWWYQNRHDLEHSYGTTPLYCVPKGLSGPRSWCPWILDARGVYFSYEEYSQKAGYIYALGNPIIFWLGVLAVSYCFGLFAETKRKEYTLLLLAYFIFWVPWIFSPRIMFFYHYLPSVPFLAISLGVVLASIWKTKFKFIAILILLIFAAAFFYFYPITTGWPIEPKSIDNFMWLKTWR